MSSMTNKQPIWWYSKIILEIWSFWRTFLLLLFIWFRGLYFRTSVLVIWSFLSRFIAILNTFSSTWWSLWSHIRVHKLRLRNLEVYFADCLRNTCSDYWRRKVDSLARNIYMNLLGFTCIQMAVGDRGNRLPNRGHFSIDLLGGSRDKEVLSWFYTFFKREEPIIKLLRCNSSVWIELTQIANDTF